VGQEKKMKTEYLPFAVEMVPDQVEDKAKVLRVKNLRKA
jgi:hypothetical protein